MLYIRFLIQILTRKVKINMKKIITIGTIVILLLTILIPTVTSIKTNEKPKNEIPTSVQETANIDIQFYKKDGTINNVEFNLPVNKIENILENKKPLKEKIRDFLNISLPSENLTKEIRDYIKNGTFYPGVTIFSMGLGTTRDFIKTVTYRSRLITFWDYCPNRLLNNSVLNNISNVAYLHVYRPNMPKFLQHRNIIWKGMQLGILFGFKDGVYIRIQGQNIPGYNRCIYLFFGHASAFIGSDFKIFENLYLKYLDLIGHEPKQ